eukprot:2541609-Prymnesium_polylepis.1
MRSRFARVGAQAAAWCGAGRCAIGILVVAKSRFSARRYMYSEMLCERPSMRAPRRRRPPPAKVCALAAPAALLPATSAPFCLNTPACPSAPKRALRAQVPLWRPVSA